MRRQIGNWLVDEPIAQGGMGIVFAARHASLPGEFALKAIRPDLTDNVKARQYFDREAKNAVQLRHPNIVRTVEKVEVDDQIFIAMERLWGAPLETKLDPAAPWGFDAAIKLIHQAAAGLGHAHARSVIHRDVKPGNIFIEDSGRVKVLDFGICRVVGETSVQSTRSGPPGTPAYMPPEALLGTKATPASDVFSLGLILFRMLTGQLPHRVPEGGSPWVVVTALVKAYTHDLPRVSSVRPEVPKALDLLVAQMLSIDPLQRPRDGNQLALAMTELLHEHPEDVMPATTALGVRGLGAPPPVLVDPEPAPGPVPRPAPLGRNPPPTVVPPTPPWATPPRTDDVPWTQVDGPPAADTRLGVQGLELLPWARASVVRSDPIARQEYSGGPPADRPGWPPPAPAVESDDEGRNQLLLLLIVGLIALAIVTTVSFSNRNQARPYQTAVPSTEGWIEVVSEPPGADIRVDFEGRTRTGVTPKTFRGLSTEFGIRPAKVRIERTGFAPRDFVVPVVPGLEQHVRATLEPLDR